MELSVFIKLIIYAIIVLLYFLSYWILIKKNDPELWVLVWSILALALYIYPLVALPKWWNCLFFLSVIIVFFSMTYEANRKADEEKERIRKEQEENNKESGSMASYGGLFL